MSEDEWLDYYEDNLAESDPDHQDIAQLEFMKEELKEGEEIDKSAESFILKNVMKAIKEGQEKISLQAEINQYDNNWKYIVYGCLILGFMMLGGVYLLVSQCKHGKAIAEDESSDSGRKSVSKDDLEMTETQVTVDHF